MMRLYWLKALDIYHCVGWYVSFFPLNAHHSAVIDTKKKLRLTVYMPLKGTTMGLSDVFLPLIMNPLMSP